MEFLKFSLSPIATGRNRSWYLPRGFALGCLLVVSILQTPSYAGRFNLSENGSGLDTLPPTFGELPHSIDGLSTPWPVGIGIMYLLEVSAVLGLVVAITQRIKLMYLELRSPSEYRLPMY